jgi:transposase
MTLEIRAAIHFLWIENRSNSEIAGRIDAAYPQDSIGLRGVQKWTKRFEKGDHGLEDALRAGRPRSQEHIDATRRLLEDDAFLSQKKIASTLGLHPLYQLQIMSILRSAKCYVNLELSAWAIN